MEPVLLREKFFTKLDSWKPSRTNKLMRYFSDVDFRNNHDGLRTIALKAGIDVSKLNCGEYLIFVNRNRTALKMFAPNNTVAHLKMPGNAKLNLKCIELLPTFFNGHSLDYTSALRKVILEDLQKKKE